MFSFLHPSGGGPNLPSVADVDIHRIRKFSKPDHCLEPVLQISREGSRELSVGQHAVLFDDARLVHELLAKHWVEFLLEVAAH